MHIDKHKRKQQTLFFRYAKQVKIKNASLVPMPPIEMGNIATITEANIPVRTKTGDASIPMLFPSKKKGMV